MYTISMFYTSYILVTITYVHYLLVLQQIYFGKSPTDKSNQMFLQDIKVNQLPFGMTRYYR